MPAQERWRAIVETAVDAVISIDSAGLIQTFNPSAERLFGYAADEVVGRNVRLLMDAATGRSHDGYVHRAAEGGEHTIIGIGREVTGRHRDGSPIALHLSVGAMRIDGDAGFVGIMRDIRPEVALRTALGARDAEYASVTNAMTDGLVVQRADGAVITSNAAARRILGLSAEQLAGRGSLDPRWRAIREDGTEIAGTEHPAMVTLRTGERVEGVVMGVEHPNGTRVWLEVTSFLIDLANEPRPGVAAVFRDITAARAAAAQLAHSERSHRLLALNATDVVVRTLWDSTIAYVSPAMGPLLGHQPADLLGRPLTDLLHPDDQLRHEATRRVIDAAPDITTTELRLSHADGSWVWCEATVRPVRGADGQIVERQSSIRSIARRKADQAALSESLGRHRALIGQLPGTAVVMFDHDLHVAVADGPAMAALAGDQPIASDRWLTIAGDESDEVRGACRGALAGEAAAWRIQRRGRIFDLTASPVQAEGRVIGGMLVAVDVTDRAVLEAEQAALHDIAHAVAVDTPPEAVLNLVAERVSSLFGAVGAAVFRLDAGNDFTAIAAAPGDREGIRPGDRFTAGEGSALHGVARSRRAGAVPDYGTSTDPLVLALRSMGAVGGAAAPITIRGELWGVLGFGGADPSRLDSSTAGRLARFADLVSATIANADERRRLRDLATTDPLTGLANRRALDMRLGEELDRVRHEGIGCAVVVIDADHFKRVNDDHGHATGDAVLASIAGTLRQAARGGDLVARIGGEEFVWLMSGAEITHAMAAAERVRAAVMETRHGEVGTVTVSAGVAVATPGDTEASLLARADRALYAAKERGRNRVIPWDTRVAVRQVTSH